MWGDTQSSSGVQLSGADQFIFAAGNGTDTIFDFEDGKDVLDLTAFAFASIQDIHMTDALNGDTYIEFTDGGSITVVGISTLQLADDILI